MNGDGVCKQTTLFDDYQGVGFGNGSMTLVSCYGWRRDITIAAIGRVGRSGNLHLCSGCYCLSASATRHALFECCVL